MTVFSPSIFSHRLMMAVAICAVTTTFTLPAMAQDSAAAATAPTVTLWRSDAAVVEAEKMIMAGKHVDALTLLDQAIARNLHNIEAHVHTALAWYHLGNNDKAKQSIKSALLIDKKHIGAHVILGLIALKEQNIDDASDYLRIIRMLCQGESCPEYQTLLRMVRETPPVENRPWYHF